jgi:hypothetical protein
MASPDEYCELVNLMPDIDSTKVSKAEVVLFYCDFMEKRVLTDNKLIDWSIFAQDKEGLLELIELTRKFVDGKAPFKKLVEFKTRYINRQYPDDLIDLYLIWQIIWPFTFDFNKSEEDSLEWFDLFWVEIPHMSVDLWRDLVALVKVRFHGRLLDNS